MDSSFPKNMVNRETVTLDFTNKHVKVIGGGAVAFRRVKRLVKAGARITVIAPEISSEFLKIQNDGKVKFIERAFLSDDIGDCFLIIAATNDPSLNAEIAGKAHLSGILCNRVDDVTGGDLGFSNTIYSDPERYSINVQSGAAGPLFGKWVGKEILSRVEHARCNFFWDVIAYARFTVGKKKYYGRTQKKDFGAV